MALDHRRLERQRRLIGRPRRLWPGGGRDCAGRRRPGELDLRRQRPSAAVVDGRRLWLRLRLPAAAATGSATATGSGPGSGGATDSGSTTAHRLHRLQPRALSQLALGRKPPRHRGGGQMLGLVDRPAHPGKLALEVGDVVVERAEVASRGTRLLGQCELDLAAPRPLGVDVLL